MSRSLPAGERLRGDALLHVDATDAIGGPRGEPCINIRASVSNPPLAELY